jgi:hypothetical protein
MILNIFPNLYVYHKKSKFFSKLFIYLGQIVPKFCVMDDSYSYGNEFNGLEQNVIITPLTERCFLTIYQTARLLKGSLICGGPNVGKTQTAKVI